VLARPPVFSARRAAASCSFLPSEPSAPVSIYSSGRAEKACTPMSFVEDAPAPRVLKPLNVFSSGRAEKSFQVLTSVPVKAVSVYSSGRAEKNFKTLATEPTKAVSVYSSGRAEKNFKTLPTEPTKAVSVYSSGRAEKNFEVLDEQKNMFDHSNESPRTHEPCPELSPVRQRVRGTDY